ncbi:type II toxin-antitoxin system Phd/YefM family antitoxin [Thermicanus aegyptius]|uniref:type II toxin-antitoxin system Phd/YefM family antitoxin n=1 Tax=Thermicanus aegyptius TaxID=94009 RepID=UPI0003FC586F|nr:type II toxin-antitoxin system Phd/YefM family antitoxin [Thermicanus aegyptius]
MKRLSATDLRRRFGEVIEDAKLEPVLIEKGGRPVVVVLSYEDYQRLQDLEDEWWGEQARKAAAEGFLSAEETEAWLKEKIHETDSEPSGT